MLYRVFVLVALESPDRFGFGGGGDGAYGGGVYSKGGNVSRYAEASISLLQSAVSTELLTRRADGASELQRPDAPFWGQAHDGARRPLPSRLASNKPAAAWDRAGGDLPLLRSQSATAIRLYSGPRRVEASLTGSPMRAAPSAPRAAWLSPRMRRGESRGLFE